MFNLQHVEWGRRHSLFSFYSAQNSSGAALLEKLFLALVTCSDSTDKCSYYKTTAHLHWTHDYQKIHSDFTNVLSQMYKTSTQHPSIINQSDSLIHCQKGEKYLLWSLRCQKRETAIKSANIFSIKDHTLGLWSCLLPLINKHSLASASVHQREFQWTTTLVHTASGKWALPTFLGVFFCA